LLHIAIEETLRYEPPVSMIARIAKQDFACEGNSFQNGQVVQLVIASANRDEAHFPNADQYDITRPPSRMLSFGNGPHSCIRARPSRARHGGSFSSSRPPRARGLPTLMRAPPRQVIQWGPPGGAWRPRGRGRGDRWVAARASAARNQGERDAMDVARPPAPGA